jgi:hypothetical protein
MSTHRKNHIYPILFLLILFSICIFVVGIQYGRSVADRDAVIDHLKSLSPTQKITPKPNVSITFTRVTNEECGISFITPSYLTKKDTDEQSVFYYDKNTLLSVSCKPNLIVTEAKNATVSLELKKASVSAQKGNINNKFTDEQLLFTLIHPESKKKIQILVSTSLYELFSGSVEFTNE